MNELWAQSALVDSHDTLVKLSNRVGWQEEV